MARRSKYIDQAADAEIEGEDASRIGSYSQDNSPTSAPQDTAQDKKNSKDADFWRFVGDVAGPAGTAIGGIGGAIAGGIGGAAAGGVGAIPGAIAGGAGGAALGGSLGKAGGDMATGYADSLTAEHEGELADYDSEEQKEADRKSALLQTLMQLRR